MITAIRVIMLIAATPTTTPSSIPASRLLYYNYSCLHYRSFFIEVFKVFLIEVFLIEVFLIEVFLIEVFLIEAFLIEAFLIEAFITEAFIAEDYVIEAFPVCLRPSNIFPQKIKNSNLLFALPELRGFFPRACAPWRVHLLS